MINFSNNYLKKNYLPRWFILIFDLSAVTFSLFFAHLLIHKLHFTLLERDLIIGQLFVTIPIYFMGFFLFRSYTEIIRHSTIEDSIKILFALSFSAIVLFSIHFFVSRTNVFYVPGSIILLQYFLVIGILTISRISIKTIYYTFFQVKIYNKNIIIYGAGDLGQMALNAIVNDMESKSKVIAFIDDNKSLNRKKLSGVPVYSIKQGFKNIIPKNDVSELIIAISRDRLKLSNKRELVDLCLDQNIKIKEIDVVSSWIGEGVNVNQFKSLRVEDILGRDSIQLDREKISKNLKKSVVLVTGAAGSIGSEIVRQLIAFNVKKVILIDNAESPLYDLQNDIIAANNNPSFICLIADVTNKKKIRKIFEKFRPSIVFNAAAYKHVPLMEEHACEAIRVNIGGTKNLADLSVEFGVKKFVFISTDKAVKPTNVMGASKRISEQYIQSLSQKSGIDTQFITTRFGNVLGSNGSVVPLFKKQIEAGGPLTVTHKEITRFFMTIPEACQLVLEAGFMGKGGEIFLFDMGEPVKVYELAKKMIALSGLVPNKDIKIKIVGLRPGEKLYEELLNNSEDVQPTHNDKIMIGRNQKHDYNEINNTISYIIEKVDDLSNNDLVAKMKLLVPEFISNNSEFSSLDNMSN